MSESNEVLTMPSTCPCAAINVYADDLGSLRKITSEEMAQLEADAAAWFEVRKIQIAIKQIKGKK